MHNQESMVSLYCREHWKKSSSKHWEREAKTWHKISKSCKWLDSESIEPTISSSDVSSSKGDNDCHILIMNVENEQIQENDQMAQ